MVEIKSAVEQKNAKYFLIGTILAAAILLLVLLLVNMGASDIGFHDVARIISSKLFGLQMPDGIKLSDAAIVWDIRLPRMLTSIFVGAGLAVAGTVFQSLLMNPLADPYTIGVSTGAAFGASLCILLNLLFAMMLPVVPFAFVSALLTLLLVVVIANRDSVMTSSNLIIAGIIVSSVMSAGISFIKTAAGEQVGAIVYWLMGSMSAAAWSDVGVVAPVVLICSAVCFIFAADLNVLSLGEENAKALGVNIKWMRRLFLIAASLITAACVSVSGVIGFVGLVVPHILRFALTPDNRVLLPLSALLGGLVLCCADSVTRVLFASEIPVGVLTTLIGGPFFLYMFMKKNKRSRGVKKTL